MNKELQDKIQDLDNQINSAQKHINEITQLKEELLGASNKERDKDFAALQKSIKNVKFKFTTDNIDYVIYLKFEGWQQHIQIYIDYERSSYKINSSRIVSFLYSFSEDEFDLFRLFDDVFDNGQGIHVIKTLDNPELTKFYKAKQKELDKWIKKYHGED